MPLAYRCVGQPAGVVRPVSPVRGFVERDQRFPNFTENQAKPVKIIVRHFLQARWHAAGELVTSEKDYVQIAQITQLYRNLTAQLVIRQRQSLQVRQPAQLGRYHPAQLV